jgi:hypothetical protein
MALDNDQLLNRIVLLEARLNEMQTALNNLATKQQMKQLLALRQADIDALQETTADHEARIVALEDLNV